MKHLLPALALAAGFAAAACGVSTPSDNRTETITGSLTPGTSRNHTYTFSKRGESMLTITSIVPTIQGSIYVGIGINTNNTCNIFTTSVQPAVLNREIAFGTLDAGTYCLQFIDPGVLVTTTTYSGTFSYP